MSDLRIGRDRHENEQILVPGRGHVRVGRTRLADVERRGVGNAAGLVEDVLEVRTPVFGEQQGVVGQLGKFALDAEQKQQSARAGGALGPPLLRVGLQRRGQQRGLGVVQVGRGDDETRGYAPAVAEAHTGGHGIRRRDLDDLARRADDGALCDGESLDRRDDLGETAARVQHAVVEVEMAHEVIQARHAVRRAAEEHGRVAEDLSQSRIGEPSIDVARERPCQQWGELAGPPQERRIAQPGGALVRVVQEARHRELIGVRRRVEVDVELRAGARLYPLEQRRGLGSTGLHIGGWEWSVDVRLAVDAIRRVERHEVQFALGGGAQQAEEVLEHLGHQVPARTGVEPEAVLLP